MQGFRPDTIALLRHLHSGFWRLPGGNFVSGWSWYDSVGEMDKRPPMFDHAWNAMQTNDVGLDEFMTLCKLIDVEPYITVNAGFGDAHSAAEEVEYINGAASTRLGAVRARNGHPEPYHVKLWNIGNEPWGTFQLGYTDLKYYVLKHNEFAKQMRKVDPSITLIASGEMLVAYKASAEVAGVVKLIIARYYAKPAAYSYFVGCSTGGREGMILSQRYPTVFNGIVSGDPAMRTGLSNLAIGKWIPVAYNQAAPKDASGRPQIEKFLTDGDRRLFMDALLKTCDAKDGVADGIISDPLGCDFDPAILACKHGQSDSCIPPEKITAIKKAFAGPMNAYSTQVYPGFLYDTGITMTGPVPGLLALGANGLFGPYTTATEIDVDKEALHANDPLVEPASTTLSTFYGSGGKIIFFHGDSDPWFSPLDTLEYYKSLAGANGGAEKVSEWGRIFLVPGMAHCGGGPALDRFDMLGAVVNWVGKGSAPESVIATGKVFPGRSRPLCAYPKHAQYTGSGDTEDAKNFRCE